MIPVKNLSSVVIEDSQSMRITKNVTDDKMSVQTFFWLKYKKEEVRVEKSKFLTRILGFK